MVLPGAAAFLCAVSTAPARADYVGDLPLGPTYHNTTAATLTGQHTYGAVQNAAGGSILNEGATTGEVVSNAGGIRNAPGATWNGDLAVGANVPGADVVNQGQWSGVLNNAGGGVDNSGTAKTVVNAAGVFANEGTVAGSLVNGGQAANAGAIQGGAVNTSNFVNNASGVVAGGLADNGATTNNGLIQGGVTETGAFTNNASGRVTGGFALSGGSATNAGEIDGGAAVAAGAFVDNGILKDGAAVTGPKATLTVNGTLDGAATTTAGSLVVNASGVVNGDVANSGSLQNAGALNGSVVNTGAFVNASGGVVSGDVRQTGGQTTNNGVIAGGASFSIGGAFNNGTIGGPVNVGAKASLIDNGLIGGATTNAGAFTENATGVVRGAFVNSGLATVNGDLAGGASNSGKLIVNASGHVEGGLTTNGGSTANAGTITGGATVVSGLMTTTGVVEGGLKDAGLVNASGTISGPIAITGALVVGDGTPSGAKLTIAPGSTVNGVVTMPVDLSTGGSNFLSAKGATLDAAQLALTGTLANPHGAYWGSISFSDASIALTASAKAALVALSGPLYSYSDPKGTGIVQTVNPGLGLTASQAATASAFALLEALPPPPSDFVRAPADPTPNVGAGAVWSRGFGGELSLSGSDAAGTGPNFDATRLATHLGGAAIGAEYGVHDLQNSGFGVRVGAEAGDAAATVTDRAGSGASASVRTPFAGVYAIAAGRGFTADVELRYVDVQMRLRDAPLAVYDQAQEARGLTITAQASYRIPAGAFFLEPEAGVSAARLAVADEPTNVGELAFGPTHLTIGHAGVRVGGDFTAGPLRFQPYLTGEIYHAWGGAGVIVVPNGPSITPTGLAGFEQVGLGVSASLAKTGLSGFAQSAWARGPNVAGLVATAGLRFDF